MKSVAVLAAFVASAAALEITEPTTGASWDLSKTNTIKWKSVSTDPTEFQLFLVDKSPSTGEVQTKISDKVKTSDGKYDLTNFVIATKPGSRYSVKAIAVTQTNSGQLDESEVFNVTKSGAATSTTPGSGSAPSGTEPPASEPTKTGNAAATLGQTFGVAGPLAVVLALLF